MLELQITKEYLGQRTSIVYLGPLFEEALRDDTWAKGAGSTVARVIDGSLYGEPLTAIAGVANTSSERNWYAFGRLAWNPISRRGSSRLHDTARTCESDGGRHPLGPRPWVAPGKGMPPDWSSTYYSRPDASGIGFDRTATGSDAVAQYSAHVAAELGNLATCPDGLLL